MKQFFILFALFLWAPWAAAEMWKCTDNDGNTRYTNVRAEAKGCKALNLDPLNTAPAFRPAPKTSTTATSSAANFPSVDSDTQRQRDVTRRKILEQELDKESEQLNIAKKQLSDQQDIRMGNEKNFARVEERLVPYQEQVKLHTSNVESLKRELANLK